MSAQALQRVVVRMLHDPDIARATAGAALTSTELGWLEAVDPRRWRADPMRRYRVLHALIEEYPVSAAALVRRVGKARFERFFEGPWFHRTVQTRGILAHAFGTWLHAQPGLAPVAALERGIALVRRVPCVRHRADPARRWRAAPWIVWGKGPLDGWMAARACLTAHPDGVVSAVLDPKLSIPDSPHTEQPWLIDGSDAPRVEEAPEALIAFLEACRAPTGWSDAMAALVTAGADSADAAELLYGFIDDALLTPASD